MNMNLIDSHNTIKLVKHCSCQAIPRVSNTNSRIFSFNFFTGPLWLLQNFCYSLRKVFLEPASLFLPSSPPWQHSKDSPIVGRVRKGHFKLQLRNGRTSVPQRSLENHSQTLKFRFFHTHITFRYKIYSNTQPQTNIINVLADCWQPHHMMT